MKAIKQFILRTKNKRKCRFGVHTTIGKDTVFFGKNYLGSFSSARNSKIGFQTYIGDYSNLDNTIIGKYTCISHCVVVVQGQHPIEKFVSIHPAFFSKDYLYSYVKNNNFADYKYIDAENKTACIIGNDVWIGYGALIMAGVKIGDGAVIGAGSIVTKDVDPFTVVAGVPAKQIKERFSKNEVLNLLKVEWWKKNEEWIKQNADLFSDIDKFLESNSK